MGVVAPRLVFLAFVGLTGSIIYNALYLQDLHGTAAVTASGQAVPAPEATPAMQSTNGIEIEMPSLLEIGRRAAMQAEREAIERVLAQTRWNRRQAAKILKISYKALLNELKAMEEQTKAQLKHEEV